MLQTSQHVLATCCDLIATRNFVAATSAQAYVVMLVTQAAEFLPPLADSTTCSGSSSSSGGSNSGS
jgi:hypothetical protein